MKKKDQQWIPNCPSKTKPGADTYIWIFQYVVDEAPVANEGTKKKNDWKKIDDEEPVEIFLLSGRQGRVGIIVIDDR